MNTVENTVGGTVRDGQIALDRPMCWTEGTRVVVTLLPNDHLIEGVWPADGSPEGEAEISRRMEGWKVEDIPGEDVAAIDVAMEEVNQFNKECLQKQKAQER